MTILDAITKADALKDNQYDQDTKVRWISDVEGRLYDEVVSWHEDTDQVAHGPYSPDTDMDTVLMVPEPYSDVYIKYLLVQIDYYNAEIDRYNNSMIMYNVALADFANWYNRTHMPKRQYAYTGLRY